MPVETFHTLIARNKRNSVILIGGFIVLFFGLGLLIGAVWGGVEDTATTEQTDVFGQPLDEPAVTQADEGPWLGVNWAFSLSVAGGAAVLAFFLTLGSWYGGSGVLLKMNGAREIEKQDDPQLFNVVEELSIAGGVPMPRVYLIDDTSMNAFATGRDPRHASVAITRGLREKLTRDELQGVMAHELSHVRHYDIRYAMLMAVLVGCVVLLSDIFLRSLWFGAGTRRRRSSRGGGGAAQAVLLVIAIVLAILAPILAKIIQLALSRQREYLADAGAIELTRNPEGLASALSKLSGDKEVLEVANRATAPLYIVHPIMKAQGEQKASLFDTHPPISERVRRLLSLTQ